MKRLTRSSYTQHASWLDHEDYRLYKAVRKARGQIRDFTVRSGIKRGRQ